MKKALCSTMTYSTQGGSSGAAVFDLNGEIVGVHVRGGCSRSSGFRANSGISIGLLVKKLAAFRNLLQDLDYVLESESKLPVILIEP